jgi:hypothetical protein
MPEELVKAFAFQPRQTILDDIFGSPDRGAVTVKTLILVLVGAHALLLTGSACCAFVFIQAT